MIKHIYDYQTDCPIENTLEVISGKWKSMILYYMLAEGINDLDQLKLKLRHCPNNILVAQLKELEADRIISKEISKDSRKPQYLITELGKSLDSVIFAMADWGILMK